jgi:hypothetical protein
MQMPEHGSLPHTELTFSQSSEPTALQKFQGQYQQRSVHDNVRGVQLFGHLLLDIARLSDFVMCAHLHFSFVGYSKLERFCILHVFQFQPDVSPV